MNGGVEGFNEWFESTMECHDMTANYTVTDADGSVYKYTCQFGETTNACHSISNMTENHEQERRFENITAEEMNLYLQKKFDGNTYVIVHTQDKSFFYVNGELVSNFTDETKAILAKTEGTHYTYVTIRDGKTKSNQTYTFIMSKENGYQQIDESTFEVIRTLNFTEQQQLLNWTQGEPLFAKYKEF